MNNPIKPPRGLFQARHYNWVAETIANMGWASEDAHFQVVSEFVGAFKEENRDVFNEDRFVEKAYWIPIGKKDGRHG